jgi:hypothetical protein
MVTIGLNGVELVRVELVRISELMSLVISVESLEVSNESEEGKFVQLVRIKTKIQDV